MDRLQLILSPEVKSAPRRRPAAAVFLIELCANKAGIRIEPDTIPPTNAESLVRMLIYKGLPERTDVSSPREGFCDVTSYRLGLSP